MNEDIQKILNKFDVVLKNYELDKAFGQMSVDSICHLFSSEILTIKNYIEAYENMRKEAIEIIDLIKPELWNISNKMTYRLLDVKNILNKVGGSDE